MEYDGQSNHDMEFHHDISGAHHEDAETRQGRNTLSEESGFLKQRLLR